MKWLPFGLASICLPLMSNTNPCNICCPHAEVVYTYLVFRMIVLNRCHCAAGHLDESSTGTRGKYEVFRHLEAKIEFDNSSFSKIPTIELSSISHAKSLRYHCDIVTNIVAIWDREHCDIYFCNQTKANDWPRYFLFSFFIFGSFQQLILPKRLHWVIFYITSGVMFTYDFGGNPSARSIWTGIVKGHPTREELLGGW